jgi:hypothetical protein
MGFTTIRHKKCILDLEEEVCIEIHLVSLAKG